MRRVAVIGAGPAGAIATDALVKEQAFDTIRVFERQHVAGGTWVFTRDEVPQIPSLRALLDGQADLPVEVPSELPCETPLDERLNSQHVRYSGTGAHEHLHSNLPPEIMCFSDEPIPRKVSARTLANFGPEAPFRHRDVMQRWVQDVFRRGKHEQLIEFNTAVERVDKKDQEWVLTLRKSDPGLRDNVWWQERFDAVVVATGHYYIPSFPRIPGLAEYDERFPGRIQHSKHYQNCEQYTNKRVIVVGGSVSAFDALHDIRLVSKLPIISSLRKPSMVFGAAPFIHPHILNRPQIRKFDADTSRITFLDGSYADDVDVVLFATGYDFSFPFLSNVKPKNGRVPGLYQHVFNTADPSLAFIGMVTGSFGLRIFEWQAVATARVLSGRAQLPSLQERQAWERARLEERGDGPAFWALMPDFERYFEDLRSLAGDPGPGTTGRVLPKYDPAWGDAFWSFVKWRINRWETDAMEGEGRRVEQAHI
ncbi:putative dimethylaniline monooxygenase [Lophiostoma macrostomum CBS 122681]|uniref:Putative dimethylaniline monooxygenase n=1 Tax=Lophiostoma macrostomum CBS 122681 TaxID=1314788 RepID=A0A6A6TPW8_9PLEO|nr:putative dimethylaniline monooxygenase [Lophiostoma macrostomum CBS 122681]